MEHTQMKPAEMLEQVNKAIAAVLVGGQRPVELVSIEVRPEHICKIVFRIGRLP